MDETINKENSDLFKEEKITDLTPALCNIDTQFECQSTFARGKVPVTGYSTWSSHEETEMVDMAIIPKNLKSIKILTDKYVSGIKFVPLGEVPTIDSDESFLIGNDPDHCDEDYDDDDDEYFGDSLYTYERFEFNLEEGERLVGILYRIGRDLSQIQFMTNLRASPVYGKSVEGDLYRVMENDDVEMVGVWSCVLCWMSSFGAVFVPRLMLIPKEIGEEKNKLLEMGARNEFLHSFGREEGRDLKAQALFNRPGRGKLDVAVVPRDIDSVQVRSQEYGIYGLEFSPRGGYEDVPMRVGFVGGDSHVFKFESGERLRGFKVFKRKNVLLGLVILTSSGRESPYFGLKESSAVPEELQVAPEGGEIVGVECHLGKMMTGFTVVVTKNG